MPDIHIQVPADLLAEFKLAADKAERSVSHQVRALMRDFVTASKPKLTPAAQAKAEKDAVRKANDVASQDRWRKLLTEGWNGRPVEPSQIKITYEDCSKTERERYDRLLAEVVRELAAKPARPPRPPDNEPMIEDYDDE